MNFAELETLLEKTHGHTKYAKVLWNSGFCATSQTPTIMDVPSPFWCFMYFERPIAVLNTLTADHLYGKVTKPQIPKRIN